MPNYFCTVGFGLDQFAAKELSLLTSVRVKKALVGKVFFSKENHPCELLSLKTIERLFVEVLHVETDSDINADTAEDWIKIKLHTEIINWNDVLTTWIAIVLRSTETQVKFRVNSRLTGKFRKLSLYQKFSSIVGTEVVENLNAIPDLYEPDLEIFFHLSETFLTIGLQVTKRPLSDRNYLKHIAVRSTVCCALCLSVNLNSDDLVLDPMCGAATILIEAIKQFNVKWAVGIDEDPSQLKLAQENLKSSCTSNSVTLLQGDSSKALLKEETFDVVLCDVPFGRKFGTTCQLKPLLKSVLKTIDSVLKPKGRVAILISEDLRQFLLDTCLNWTPVSQHPLRLGTLPAVILCWCK